MRIEFTVHGTALPAGSKQSYPVLDKHGEPVRTKTGRILTRAKHSNPKTKGWMDRVANIAREHYGGPLLNGPIWLRICFYRIRPKSHYGSGRNATKLKPSAPGYPTTRPDSLKLGRAIEDALSGVIWRDDSQVVEHEISKVWGNSERVYIAIESHEAKEDSNAH